MHLQQQYFIQGRFCDGVTRELFLSSSVDAKCRVDTYHHPSYSLTGADRWTNDGNLLLMCDIRSVGVSPCWGNKGLTVRQSCLLSGTFPLQGRRGTRPRSSAVQLKHLAKLDGHEAQNILENYLWQGASWKRGLKNTHIWGISITSLDSLGLYHYSSSFC